MEKRRVYAATITLLAFFGTGVVIGGVIVHALPVTQMTEKVPVFHTLIEAIDSASEPSNTVLYPARGIPEDTCTGRIDVERHTAIFRHDHPDTTRLLKDGGDADTFTHHNNTYIVATRGDSQALYLFNRSDLTATLVDAHYLGEKSIDSIIEANDSYLAYADGVYQSDSPVKDDWVKKSSLLTFNDVGAYYHRGTGNVHLYYEKGYAQGPSGGEIGHAVSPNGYSNWTLYPSVTERVEDVGVGDFEVVKANGSFFIFGDRDRFHPKYNVSVWVNSNLYTRFKRLPRPAITGSRQAGREDSFGVGDASILETGGRYFMLGNGYVDGPSASSQAVYLYGGTLHSVGVSGCTRISVDG